jgi:protein tyrosine phosphatase (PTP) superfamily phosphohydrolase (DUF442 family)
MSFLTARVLALWAFALPVFAGSVPGIKNFDRVDAHVYRGAQPTEEGFQYLAKQLGGQTIIDLREADDRSEGEDRAVTAAGMKYVNVPMSGRTPPTTEEIARILGILEDGTTGPVFVHCRRGADRTGAVIAAYHIDHDRWDNVRALNDAKAHSMSFFQLPRQKFISSFQPRTVDVKTTVADNHGAPAFSSEAVAAGATN